MNPITSNKPIIGVSMGDPSGVGPEIIIKHMVYESTTKDRIVIFGCRDVFEYYLDMFNIAIPINNISSEDKIREEFHEGEMNIIEVGKFNVKDIELGKVNKHSGKIAFESALQTINAAINGKIDAVVTAPFNKEAINLAGYNYIGHTELLAEKTNTKDYVMMLAAKRFRVALVTTHISLKEVPDMITKDRVLKTIKIVDNDLRKWFGIEKPKIAVSALNPHNSEGGLMGDEEQREIIPAIKEAKRLGIDVHGSFAADTLFIKEKRGKYDCYIAMYHDQGLVPLKALYFDSSVNITLGIPIIRTSPDHGTAFDIVGQFKADHRSLTEAIRQAHRMARWKQKNH